MRQCKSKRQCQANLSQSGGKRVTEPKITSDFADISAQISREPNDPCSNSSADPEGNRYSTVPHYIPERNNSNANPEGNSTSLIGPWCVQFRSNSSANPEGNSEAIRDQSIGKDTAELK